MKNHIIECQAWFVLLSCFVSHPCTLYIHLYIFMYIQALSLMDYNEYQQTPKGSTIQSQQSNFFDPAFWNNDFEKRKKVRKKELSINLKDIDLMDYAELEETESKNGYDDDDEKLLSVLSSDKKKKSKHRKKGTLADIDEDVDRQQTVANHAKAITKIKLKRYAKKELFMMDIKDVFDPKYNKRWIQALCGQDDENVLHFVDDNTNHQRKSTMAH